MANSLMRCPALVKHTSEWTAVGATHMWTYAGERLPSMWLVLEADAESSGRRHDSQRSK